ncbi:ATP-binding cassette domain-containing protein [Oscillospiraceae bacterium LTW-04]|nr:ATP-binding cassette domain-containing protein [Oscillospiraceae bacterium MB24-C1]
MDNIITIKGLSKTYRVGAEKVKALSNINLAIGKGEICCILGTSGSGKSTLLNQLAGLEKPTAGSVYIGKTNISRLTEDQLAGFRQKYVGFVFQSYNLIPSMTATENVAMPLLFRGVPREVRDRESLQMLKKVGLGNRARHKPSEMSGGQQQRVGIARAFVAKPKIVFADEPTGNLDSRTTLEVMRLLIEMAHDNGITFVLVTHDNELARYADRIITIRDGMVISDETNPHPAYLDPVPVGEASTKTLPSLEDVQPEAPSLSVEDAVEGTEAAAQSNIAPAPDNNVQPPNETQAEVAEPKPLADNQPEIAAQSPPGKTQPKPNEPQSEPTTEGKTDE